MADSSAFIVRGEDGVEYGPVDLAELRDWVKEHRVGLGTEVRRESGDEDSWEPWQNYPELVALLAEVHATGSMLPPLPVAAPVLAPFGRRVLACLVDLFLAFILIMPPAVVLYWLQPEQLIIRQSEYSLQFFQALMQGVNPPDPAPDIATWYPFCENLLSFLMPMLYFAGFHAAHGRTPAKSVLHLRVVDSLGRKPTFRMALLRGLVFMISVKLLGIPLFYAFFNPQRRALHDIAAGTYVVER